MSRTTRRPWLAIVPVILALLPIDALAQETTGRIEGYAPDAEGRPVVAATVTAGGPDLIGERTAVTGADGYFVLAGLPVGTYELKIAAAGFAELVLTGVTVRLGRTVSVGTVDVGAPVFEMETVVVTARAPLVDPVETTVGADLIADEYRELPIDRIYRGLTTLLPYVEQSFLVMRY